MRFFKFNQWLATIAYMTLPAAIWPVQAAIPSLSELSKLSIEELANVQISSVSRRAEPLKSAAAAVFVISNDDIRRSGATSLPEALRLAPNLMVGQIDSANYTVSARGFNSQEANNKLLVLIDGRSVYSTLLSGVFWDAQYVPLEDIERIEVISGPAGTLWGANAVNGVINIITKSAKKTEGGVAQLRVGLPRERQVFGRIGAPLDENTSLRIYATAYEHAPSVSTTGTRIRDEYNNAQGGFRLDWEQGHHEATLQGDLYNNDSEGSGYLEGGNILGRYIYRSDRGLIMLRNYYDETRRVAPGIVDTTKTYDISALNNIKLGRIHNLGWGAGYRRISDTFDSVLATKLVPSERLIHLTNFFLQNELALTPTFNLTLGAKIEHSSYTGTEFLPSIRAAWHPSDDVLLWAAISRAARTPARVDRDISVQVGPATALTGTPDFESEKVIAYELGYRGQPDSRSTLSISLYFNQYDDLRILQATPGTVFPLRIINGAEGYTYGAEIWGTYTPVQWWQLSAGVNLMQKELHPKPGRVDFTRLQSGGNDPDYQVSLRSRMNLPGNIELDVGARTVDDLPNPAISSYIELNARLGWHINENFEVAIAGFNLLDQYHPESFTANFRRQARRNGYISGAWRF